MNFKRIKTFGSIGCSGTYPAIENRYIQLTNFCCLIGILSILLFNTTRIFTDFNRALIPISLISLFIPVLILAIWLNSRKHHSAASILANLTFTLSVFISTGIYLGKLPGVHFYFLLFAMVPTITISIKKFHIILLLALLNLLCFIYVEEFKSPASILYHFSPAVTSIYRMATIISTFSTIIFIIWANQVILNKNENKLLKQSDALLMLNKELSSQYTITKQQAKEIEAHNQYLQKINLELSQLNTTRDKFFSIIAHDLRHPFGIILGFSEILIDKLKDTPTSQITECAKYIQSSSQQTYELLENLLNWASSQNGTMPFNTEAIDLKQIVEDEANKISGFAGQKSIDIRNNIVTSIPIEADKNMIDTILRNLLTNAIKFTPKGGIIELSASSINQYAEIRIKDNGLGIEPSLKEKLFNREINQSAIGTNHERGTGLGLILCKEFVEKHGGQIWVESEPGHGSNFIFTIPLALNHTNTLSNKITT